MIGIQEYQEMAARTLIEKPDNYSDFEMFLVWNAIGLAGEAGELLQMFEGMIFDNRQNSMLRVADLEDELGDLTWYLSAICTKADIRLEEVAMLARQQVIPYYSTKLFVGAIVSEALTICEQVKKQVFHKQGVDIGTLRNRLATIYRAMLELCVVYDFCLSEVMEKNIRKLEVRFENGFNYQDAKRRKDKKE